MSTRCVGRMSFEQACFNYTERYTMEHVPNWASAPCNGNGKFYAPQFRTDREWYNNTVFPPESGHRSDCYTSGETWPLGEWLDAPYLVTLPRSK